MQTLLSIQNLTVRYGKDVALQIEEPIVMEEGDRIGVIGSNGAGKSTLIKSILGITAYEGTIETSLKPEEMATHMQFNEYTNTMPVKYIMEAILDTKIGKNKKLSELISYFEFEDCLKKRYSNLSGGQTQRFTIILVMMQEAPLTFYDEVTSGLDFETRQRLMEKLVEWYRDKECGLFVVSHYYEELEQLAEKLLILDKGHVIAFGKKDELFHKYCGKAVFVLDNSVENRKLLAHYQKLESPAHLLALPCNDLETERELTDLFIQNNVNYKRSNQDIEMIYVNAKAAYEKRIGGEQ